MVVAQATVFWSIKDSQYNEINILSIEMEKSSLLYSR